MQMTWNIHLDENLKKRKSNMKMTQMFKILLAASLSLKNLMYQVWVFLISTFVGMKQQSHTLMCNNLIYIMYYQYLTGI